MDKPNQFSDPQQANLSRIYQENLKNLEGDSLSNKRMDKFYKRHNIPIVHICSEELASLPLIYRLKSYSSSKFEQLDYDESK